jgi:hypothetical protein
MRAELPDRKKICNWTRGGEAQAGRSTGREHPRLPPKRSVPHVGESKSTAEQKKTATTGPTSSWASSEEDAVALQAAETGGTESGPSKAALRAAPREAGSLLDGHAVARHRLTTLAPRALRMGGAWLGRQRITFLI